MYKYHCLNPISPVGLGNFSTDYEKTDHLADAQAILVRSAAMHDMELPDGLQAVARAGAGVNNIPLDKCAGQGIVVFNTPGANANGVKELVIAGMLLASRDIVGGIQWVASQAGEADVAKTTEKQKKQYAGTEIAGKKLGVIGLGAIGVRVANAAIHLGMEVYGFDPFMSVDAAWSMSKHVQHANTVEDIYRECDFITIHVPLSDATRKMVNADAVAMMKENAVLLNFSRDALVDEEAVLAALDAGKIRKYVCDFPNPLTAGHKDCIIIPHLGASTEESEDNCAAMAVQELMDYLENGNISHSVNYPDCSMGVCSAAGRIAILHRNIKGMIGRFSSVLAEADFNISDMTNKSKGDYAYTLFDLDAPPSKEVAEKLEAIDSVLRVRIIKA